ncbi:sensor domain-containing diguanylate cyclase [Dickeya undicola]|nr:sensor domain-containing diguanylate cyclase [Dickeya undicola]
MKTKKSLQLNLLHLILFIALFSMLVTIVNGYFSIYYVQKEIIKKQSFQSDINYSSGLAASTDMFFSTAESQLAYSAALLSNDVHYGNFARLQSEVQRIHQFSPYFNSIVVVSTRKIIIASSPPELKLSGMPLVSHASKMALESRGLFISSPYTSITGNYLFFISMPIFDDAGNYLGYIGGTIYLNNQKIINQFMKTQFNNEELNTYVIDKEGTMLYSSNISNIGNKFYDLSFMEAAFQQEKGSIMMPDEHGVLSPAGFARIKKSDWIVITQQPMQVMEETLRSVMIQVLKIGAPAGLLTSLILMLLAFYITRPLRQLAKSASAMDQPGVISKIRSVKAWYNEVEQLKRVLLMGTVLLHKRIGRLSSEAYTDPLSGMLNRRGMQESLEEIRNEYKKISVIAIDIDHFKLINDSFGHDVGDEVIRKLSQQIRKNFRKTDLICRIGGEEFLILLPGSDIHVAIAIAERLRHNVANTVYLSGSNHRQITISIGVTTFDPQKSALDVAIKTADNALYKAKNGGRNQVVVEHLSEDISLAQP